MSNGQPITVGETVAQLACVLERATPVGFDSEGLAWPTCLGFATSPTSVLVVDTLALRDHPSAAPIWGLLRAIIESREIVKHVWGLGHERAFCQWTLGWVLRSGSDAMFRWAERWPELPKRLKYAASVLTRLPCWTDGISWRESDKDEASAAGVKLWTYNGYDCLSTYQLATHPQLALTGARLDRVAFNHALVEPYNWMSQKGVLYDTERLETLRAEIEPKRWAAQAEVDALASCPLPKLIAHARDHLCFKKARALITTLRAAEKHAKKDHVAGLKRVRVLLRGKLTPAARGELGALLGSGLNVKSNPDVTATLNALGLPPVFKRGKRKDDDEGEPSQSKDAAALLSVYQRTGHPITTAILRVMDWRGKLQELERGTDADTGTFPATRRIRCSYLIPGTETARVVSHKWLTGSGGNLQTVPKEPINFRVLYRADPGHTFWACDLTGADLWTVACRCAELGDRTMLEDLQAGIRIPSLLGLMLEQGYRPGSDRAAIASDCRAYRAGLKASGQGWKDTLWKISSHLSNYYGKPPTIRANVIEHSYAETGTPVDPGIDICRRAQSVYLARYWGIPRWWSRTAATVTRTGELAMATGQTREFLSRRVSHGCLDDATRREALAAEPQSVTTWVTNRALLALWSDIENWPSGQVGEGEPVVQPLLSTHDELGGQLPIETRDWSILKIIKYFTQPVTIGGITITMPFALGTGPSWGETH